MGEFYDAMVSERSQMHMNNYSMIPRSKIGNTILQGKCMTLRRKATSGQLERFCILIGGSYGSTGKDSLSNAGDTGDLGLPLGWEDP